MSVHSSNVTAWRRREMTCTELGSIGRRFKSTPAPSFAGTPSFQRYVRMHQCSANLGPLWYLFDYSLNHTPKMFTHITGKNWRLIQPKMCHFSCRTLCPVHRRWNRCCWSGPAGPAMAGPFLADEYVFDFCVISFLLKCCSKIRQGTYVITTHNTFSMTKLPADLPGEPHQPLLFPFPKRTFCQKIALRYLCHVV